MNYKVRGRDGKMLDVKYYKGNLGWVYLISGPDGSYKGSGIDGWYKNTKAFLKSIKKA